MIQPALLKYSLDNTDPVPVPLDEEEMTDDVILLLDSYFNVIEWYGENAENWFQEKYHEIEEYQHIADFLTHPRVISITLWQVGSPCLITIEFVQTTPKRDTSRAE
jgi:hypothetical protein